MRRGNLASVAAVMLLAGACVGTAWWRQQARADEWRHGGDAVTVSAVIRTATPDQFPGAVAALSGPDGRLITQTRQAVVTRVTWSVGPSTAGSYQFLVLDHRVGPPKPLRPYGGWWPGGETGSNWDGRYGVLAGHYPWLARTVPRRTAAGWADTTEAIGVPVSAGTATLAFAFDRLDIPTRQPERDLILAMVLVDGSGEVRWAKQVPLHTS